MKIVELCLIALAAAGPAFAAGGDAGPTPLATPANIGAVPAIVTISTSRPSSRK